MFTLTAITAGAAALHIPEGGVNWPLLIGCLLFWPLLAFISNLIYPMP